MQALMGPGGKLAATPLFLLSLLALTASPGAGQTVDLANNAWFCRLDARDVGLQQQWQRRSFTQPVRLPGSLQEQGLGDEVTVETKWTGSVNERSWYTSEKYEKYRQPGKLKIPFWLQPEKHYTGAAWYQTEVVLRSAAEGKQLTLFLERPHWETTVWVDQTQVAAPQNSLSTPHVYELPRGLTAGNHRLTIRVDNRVKDIDVGINSHSISDHTQTNWNGIVGRLELGIRDPVWIDAVQVYPNLAAKSVNVHLSIGNATGAAADGAVVVEAQAQNTLTPHKVTAQKYPVSIRVADRQTAIIDYPLGEAVQTWDEFHPAIYRLSVKLEARAGETRHVDTRSVDFGMRELQVEGRRFLLNGRPVLFRGTLECCIFPLTGYPPTDVESWKRLIRICKSYGLNHIRFHSHCPPEAAFIAADSLGFYYQVECASWANGSASVGEGRPLDKWLYEEVDRIVQAYGNHPSFMLLAYGNEPRGPGRGADYLGPWTRNVKQKDSRRLVTAAAGWPNVKESHYSNLFGTRLHRRLNATPPQTEFDYREAVAKQDAPLISHEPGQWCVFPNLQEIGKYRGVLKARNFEIVSDFLREKGLLHQARDFLMASGKFQALCYKQEIETFLRTPEMGGFQLLDLHDFPGQGTALVGVLDPFWEEKGYLTAAQHRRYCGPVTPLARMSKRVWTSEEPFVSQIEVSQFGPRDLRQATVRWKLADDADAAIGSGRWTDVDLPAGQLVPVGTIQQSLRAVKQAARLRLSVEIEGVEAANDWDLWVYPPAVDLSPADALTVVSALDAAAVQRLRGGGRVLLLAPPAAVGGDTHGSFEPIFWNKLWFPTQREHTLGILCDPGHLAFAQFPTDFHANWQWWELLVRSRPMVMDALPRELFPLVQAIDDWNRCRKLGLLFEAKVEGGKLLVCSIDLNQGLNGRPVARQLRHSLQRYMASERFNPAVEVPLPAIRSLFRSPGD